MKELLNQKSTRVLIALGMYLLYEIAEKIIESNYSLEFTYDDKSIILQKQPIDTSTAIDANNEQNC